MNIVTQDLRGGKIRAFEHSLINLLPQKLSFNKRRTRAAQYIQVDWANQSLTSI